MMKIHAWQNRGFIISFQCIFIISFQCLIILINQSILIAAMHEKIPQQQKNKKIHQINFTELKSVSLGINLIWALILWQYKAGNLKFTELKSVSLGMNLIRAWILLQHKSGFCKFAELKLDFPGIFPVPHPAKSGNQSGQCPLVSSFNKNW